MLVSSYIAPGTRFYALAQHAVTSILGTKKIHRPVVLEEGTSFYNVDTWGTLLLLGILTQLMVGKTNLNLSETEQIPVSWGTLHTSLQKAIDFSLKTKTPRIVVAPIADNDTSLGVAFLGGCNHEAFHTMYTPRETLEWQDIEDYSRAVESRIRHNEVSAGLLSSILGILEDVRIEILGGESFPGTRQSLHDIHDWILNNRLKPEITGNFGLLEAVEIFLHVEGFDYPTQTTRLTRGEIHREFPTLIPLFEGEVKKILTRLRNQAYQDMAAMWASLEVVEAVQALPEYEEAEKALLEKIQKKKEAETFLEEMIQAILTLNSGKKDKKGGGGTLEDLLKVLDKNLVDKMVLGKEAYGSLNDTNPVTSGPASNRSRSHRPEVMRVTPVAGEMMWNPVSVANDTTVSVRPRQGVAQPIHRSIMQTIGYARAQLRNILLAQQWHVEEHHGLRQGPMLSPLRIAETGAALWMGEAPTSAFFEVTEGRDISAAAVIVLDESPSMDGSLEGTVGGTLAFIEPLESIGGKSLVVGIQDKAPYSHGATRDHHRNYAVLYRIYKTWEQTVRGCLDSLGNYKTGGGGTPLADGIYFGLLQILQRQESHRFLVVITDGLPNHNDVKVIRHLIRVAEENHIRIIGVGIGDYMTGVETLFHDVVVVPRAQDLPVPMVKLLRDIMCAPSRNR